MKELDLKIEELPIENLVPYTNNANIHSQHQIDQIAASIEEFGFADPVGVWENAAGEVEVVEGHGRVMAAKKLGYDKLPVIYLNALSDEQRRAYTHIHNQLTRNSVFDVAILDAEIEALDFDWESFGFNESVELLDGHDFFENKKSYSGVGETEEYKDFLDKFEIKKTTDDCYTPDNIYEVIAEYVCNTYGVNKSDIVRPFYPGGDYTKFDYDGGKVVVDNPPFSIMAEILDFYIENDVPFFLFCEGKTAFGNMRRGGVSGIMTGSNITYENGANVLTSFLTNMDENKIKTSPELFKQIDEANKENLSEIHAQLDRYEYPPCVLTSTRVGDLSKYGIVLAFKQNEVSFIRALESQKEDGKAIYGGGFLAPMEPCELAAKEAKEAKEAIPWLLSDSEISIVAELDKVYKQRMNNK